MTAYDTGGAGAAAPAPGRVGLFGKLPDRGDFVRRDLPNGFVDAWDAWLQQGIAASKTTLDDGWLDAWLCAPIWRFALPAGMCGPDAWAGVMMPSVDRAGRYFPLTLAAIASHGLPAAMLAGDWIVALESVVLSALDEGCSFDQFADAVAGLPAFPAIRTETWDRGWRARGPLGDPTAAALALGAASAATLSTYCVFATRGGGRVAPAAWVLPHLPPSRSFIGFIDDLDTGGVPHVATAVPAGMAVPMWIGGTTAVPPLPTADTELGHAASLFGTDYATDVPQSLEGEPPGGAFDNLFDGPPRQPMAGPTPGAFDQPPMAAPAPMSDPLRMPAAKAAASWQAAVPGTPSGGAFDRLFDEQPGQATGASMPAAFDQPSMALSEIPMSDAGPSAASWQLPPPADASAPPPGELSASAFDRLLDDPSQQPAPAAPPGGAFDQSPMVASDMPEASPTDSGPADAPAAGAQAAIALDAPRGHEKDVKPSPKDLFGDVDDDVPPAPSGLFDHKEGRGSPS